ncbi:hypothetical protein AS850_14515 [Frondihabitans sp. 762G35]|uniref:hypothetical protein n=1 Tax=Frondihabitans sp. 762G35 TaxID=1446794 RepID=UPI000D2013AB|nr:hypothetical protein [Frondihabitans sp. 762G35]ARC58295.1 hypothetical protein AS850_14515 [Frondihabitans sp. 762G35]
MTTEYYLMNRHEGVPGYEPEYYRVTGATQYRLREGAWVELGAKGTYKNEPLWWRINGHEDFSEITVEELPPGTPA